MYTIAICEDRDDDRKRTRENLDRYFEECHGSYKLHSYWSGEEFIRHMQAYKYDLAIFDIEMLAINGIEAAKKLREIDKSVIIIFVSAHADMVFSSFSAEPLHFLVKPLEYLPFKAIMDRVTQKIEESKEECFVASFNGVISRIPIKEIVFFESLGRIVKTQTVNEAYRSYAKLGDIEKSFEKKGFIRCHQSFLVNPVFIQRLEKDQLHLMTGKTICISRARLKGVKEKFMAYIGELMDD